MPTADNTQNARAQQRQFSRTLILEAAVERFAAAGFEAASMAAIAERAGVKKALVQYHFTTKDQLWRAAASLLWEHRNEALGHHLSTDNPDGPLERLRGGFTALVTYTREHPQWLWFMFHEAAANGPRMAWLIERYINDDYRLGEAFIERMQASGVVRQGSPLQLLHLISGALSYNTLVAPQTLRATGLDLASEEAIAEQVELIMQMIGAPVVS